MIGSTSLGFTLQGYALKGEDGRYGVIFYGAAALSLTNSGNKSISKGAGQESKEQDLLFTLKFELNSNRVYTSAISINHFEAVLL